MAMRWCILLLPLLGLAQSPADLFQKAPPDVEEALRPRVQQFFQYHVDGKFRLAETLVAEDSKDFFYSANKPRYLSFEISKIEYSDEFTKAKATVICEMFIPVLGFTTTPMKVPIPSHWKLVDGVWYWYVDTSKLNETPFGTMKPGPNGGGAAGLPAPPTPETAKQLLAGAVRVDKSSVQFKPGVNATDHVTIENHMPGKITLALNSPAGDSLELKLDRTALNAGEKAVLLVHAKPETPPHPRTVNVRVVETNQVLPVKISFTKP